MTIDAFAHAQLPPPPALQTIPQPAVQGRLAQMGCPSFFSQRPNKHLTLNSQRGCYTKYLISFVRHYKYELYLLERRKVLCFLSD